MRALAVLPLLALSAGQPSPPQTCPKPLPVPVTVTAPSSTYYTDVEPPARFAHVPPQSLTISFGQDAIARLCGRPPCGMIFLGCTRGNEMALPDPFTTDSQTFARIVRHELGHVAGWPATHGE